MSCLSISRPIAAAAIALFLPPAALAHQPPAAIEQLPRLAAPAGKYLGALSCASASCHGRQDEQAEPGSVSRREFTVWLEHDPHSRAGRTLQSPKFALILRRVSSGRDDGPANEAVYERCARCHDPAASEKGSGVFGEQATSLADSYRPPKTPDPLAHHPIARGFTCETCHGPAGDWIAEHYERDATRERLVSLGMTDTKNLAVRAQLCAGCHVGDGERDVNHDMIAAGHPPLRFELSAYHDLVHRKHWPAAERIHTRAFKARLWAEGQAATIRSTLDLLHSRAARAASGERLTPWPELAEYDCFACHQRLRPGDRPSDVAKKSERPGMPGWQAWNLALAEHLITEDRAEAACAELHDRMNRSLVTDAGMVRDLAATARAALKIDRPASADQIAAIVGATIDRDGSWAARSQQLLALRAADLAIRDERLRLQPPPGFVAIAYGREQPRRDAVDDYDRQWRSIAAALQFGSPDFEWPASDWAGLGPALAGQPVLSADELEPALRRLATALGEQAGGTGR